MTDKPIVALGFLSQSELDILGQSFDRYIPVVHDNAFDDLLAKLDEIDEPHVGEDIVLRLSVPSSAGKTS